MQFQIINDNYYKKLVEKIQEGVSEFKSVFYDDEEEYWIPFIISEFGSFIIDNIEDKVLFNKCLNVLNIALEEGGYKTQLVIIEEIFNKFFVNSNYSMLAQEHLTNNAKNVFNEYYLQYKENIEF